MFEEGLTRNAPAFARFFEALSFSHGKLVNYSNVARDCGVTSKTVKEYFRILVDTLLGVLVEPFGRRRSRAVITKAPKFYLFDVGVAGHVTGRRIERAAKDGGRDADSAVGEVFGEAVGGWGGVRGGGGCTLMRCSDTVVPAAANTVCAS